jgi:4-diphosphocytidyl-2-C-methyl-D-erythritol kinase
VGGIIEAVILPAPTVHVRAPGKINLFFEVGALGADGYHDVASAYQAVSAYEDVWASASDDLTIEVTGSVDVAGVPLDARNLAVRAAQLVANEAGIDAGVHLRIVKGVPVAGGMGGGSADAAAALVACDALWGTGISPIRLRELAAELGADVPFALTGGTAIGLGRGDDLSPALARGRFDWVIVTSEDGLSTPAVFAALDAHRDDASLDIVPARRPMVDDAVLHALRAGDAHMLAASLRNDLQQAALALRPDLADLLETGRAAGALEGIVSGSGPTVAFLAAGPEAAIDLQMHGPVPGARVIHDD